jgi:hypothetical protein
MYAGTGSEVYCLHKTQNYAITCHFTISEDRLVYAEQRFFNAPDYMGILPLGLILIFFCSYCYLTRRPHPPAYLPVQPFTIQGIVL